MRKQLRPLLNQLRRVNKLPMLERFIAARTQGKRLDNLWVKLLPPLESYQRGSIREVERNGIRYRLDISDYIEYVIYFGLEAEPKEALYGSVKNGMQVFDIGTNMGETLLNFARINKKGNNYGFEPVPFLFEKAKANLALNAFQNVHLNNLAVSNTAGTLYFDIPANRNFGSISMSDVKTETSKAVRAITFDEFVAEEQIEAVDFIKIDVEGFECKVLEGADAAITRWKPVLFIEVVDAYLRKNGNTAEQLISLIKAKGYKVYDAESLEEIKEPGNANNLRLDILCKPN